MINMVLTGWLYRIEEPDGEYLVLCSKPLGDYKSIDAVEQSPFRLAEKKGASIEPLFKLLEPMLGRKVKITVEEVKQT